MAKKTEVKVGQIWTAKVNGRQVKVTGITVDRHSGRTKFTLENVKTGRRLMDRTAAFLRRLLKDVD